MKTREVINIESRNGFMNKSLNCAREHVRDSHKENKIQLNKAL